MKTRVAKKIAAKKIQLHGSIGIDIVLKKMLADIFEMQTNRHSCGIDWKKDGGLEKWITRGRLHKWRGWMNLGFILGDIDFLYLWDRKVKTWFIKNHFWAYCAVKNSLFYFYCMKDRQQKILTPMSSANLGYSLWTKRIQYFKGIFQPFELGAETSLIQSEVKFFKAGHFQNFFLMIQSHERSLKPISAA